MLEKKSVGLNGYREILFLSDSRNSIFKLLVLNPGSNNRRCSTTGDTHYVHEGEEVVLNVFFAVEPDHGVVHAQQHLDVVVVVSRVPPSPQGLVQLLLRAAVQGAQLAETAEKRLCEE